MYYSSILFVLVIGLIIFIYARPDIIRKFPRFKMLWGPYVVLSLVSLVSYTRILKSKEEFFILLILGFIALSGYYIALKKLNKIRREFDERILKDAIIMLIGGVAFSIVSAVVAKLIK